MKYTDKIISAFKLLKNAYGNYRRQIFVLAILGILGGVLEGVGINALIPLLSFAVAGRDTSPDNIILNFIKELFSFLNFPFTLKFLLIFACLLFIFKAAVSIFSGYISVRIVSDYEQKARTNLLRTTLGASWPHLLKQKVGYLETILMVDIKKSSLLLEQLAGMISNFSNLVVYLFVAFNISWNITSLTLGLGALLFLVSKPLLDKTLFISKQITAANKDVAHFVNENILGAKTIKSLSVEEAIAASGRNYFRGLRNLQICNYILKKFVSASSQPVSIIFISFIFALFYRMPHFNLAALLVVIYLIQRIFLYIQLFQNSVQGIYENIPYLSTVLNYELVTLDNKEETRGDRKFTFANDVVFDNVFFSYGQNIQLLRGINFKINKAEIVGLAGLSGSGKTTIVDLALRLLKPASGRILIDGRDIWEIDLREWRKHIGYVPQDIFLKNDTFENNIKFYNPNVSDADMHTAARMANISDLIENAQFKFKTSVGERGVLISGGQRQRIVLARILARKPQFLILDEATSALDAESEAMIQHAIDNLKGKITILVIAHRLETMMSCDRLLVLDEGKIIEEGAPAELLRNTASRFYKMHNLDNAKQ